MLRLLISDIRQEYGGLSFFIFAKSLLNPSIYACLLVRLAANSKGIIHIIIRNILVAKHSIDVGQSISIGTGLKSTHSFCIVIGFGVVIGAGYSISSLASSVSMARFVTRLSS